MGDRIVVMSNAVIQQIGTPAEVYADPANLFVARFVGSPGMNLITGTYTEGVIHLPGDNVYAVPEVWRATLDQHVAAKPVIVGFRPEAATLSPTGALRGELYADDLHGAYALYHLALAPNATESIVHVRAGRDGHSAIGSPLRFDLDPNRVRFFDAASEAALPLPAAAQPVTPPSVEVIHG